MSIQAVAWALEQDLPARPKLVLVSIANHANHVDGYCWLKAETIAREAACTPRSIYNYVGMLVRNGFIRKSRRKGEDGKQRANDYWMLFDREEKPWDASASLDESEGDDALEENASEEAAAQDVVEPHERISYGEEAVPSERHDSRQAVDTPAGSSGPCEAAFTRKRIAEPSNTKPEASSAGARIRSAALRAYRPPPPQPVAADTEAKVNPIFVFEGSRAWDAWVAFEKKRRGVTWTLATRKQVDGKWRTGWYWPTLFPPNAQAPPESPTKDTLCTENDLKQQL